MISVSILRWRLYLPRVCFSLIVLLALVGCSTGAQPAATPPAQPVRVQLAWIHSIEYSGLYMAQDQGDYAATGLDVTLDILGERSPIDAVADGAADFGVTSADSLLLARAAGKPLVAVATIYQRSPVAFISLEEKHIISPEDLVGKTVVVDMKGTTAVVYRAMLAAQGIDAATINTQPRADFSNAALLSGQADVIDAYINNQPIQLKQEGHAINAILASDYGIDLYPNVIFTTEELIATQPARVAAFVQATTRGMQRVIDKPDTAITATTSRDSKLSSQSESESLRLALPLMRPANSQPGAMTAGNWQATHQMLLDQKLITSPLELDKAFTLQFLSPATP
jgi:NitT/TauT family transport system substrate-binding protein